MLEGALDESTSATGQVRSSTSLFVCPINEWDITLYAETAFDWTNHKAVAKAHRNGDCLKYIIMLGFRARLERHGFSKQVTSPRFTIFFKDTCIKTNLQHIKFVFIISA